MAKDNVNLDDNPYYAAYLSCYRQLVEALPMDAMYPTLVSKGLLREVSLQQEIAATRTDYGKARVFLDSMTGGLKLGVTDTFKSFLEAMDEYARNNNNAVVKKLLSNVNEHLPTPLGYSAKVVPTVQPTSSSAAPITVTPECSTLIRKIEVHRRDLEDLPINTMLALLYGRKVISIEEKRTMDKTSLSSDKITYLLDSVLVPSLESGDMEKFNRFCEVLEEKGHTAMARRLGLPR